MDEFDCPKCGSDDVRGERQPGGTIALTCQSCEASWMRVPKPSCPRCGKGDVEEYGHENWAYDDPAAAKEDPAAAGSYAEHRMFRCRKCHHTWGKAQ
jgi:transposase-like protein